MTKAITLESVIEQFRDALVDGWMFGDYHYGIPDFKVILKLGFTPQSWTRYRPLLIRYCQCYDLIKTEVRDGVKIETIRLAIRFHKKSKLWHGKRNALMLDDIEKGTWRKMTDDELEKYNLYWYHEEEFFL